MAETLIPEPLQEFAARMNKMADDLKANLEARPQGAGGPNLRRKLVAAMKNLPVIEKKGVNKFFGYTYIRAEDINQAVRTALAEAGVAFMAEELEITDYEPVPTKNEGIQNVCRIRMEYTFYDTDTDERLVAHSTGEGMDTGDKVILKAKTSALKSFLKQQFLIASEEDDVEAGDEADAPVDRGSARGGAPALSKTACPNCGVVGALIVGKKEFGGGYVCWKKAKTPGCGANFPEGFDFATGQMQAPNEPAPQTDGSAPGSGQMEMGATNPTPAPKRQPARTAARKSDDPGLVPASAADRWALREKMIAHNYAEVDLDQIVSDYFGEKGVQVAGVDALNYGQVLHLAAVLDKGKTD